MSKPGYSTHEVYADVPFIMFAHRKSHLKGKKADKHGNHMGTFYTAG